MALLFAPVCVGATLFWLSARLVVSRLNIRGAYLPLIRRLSDLHPGQALDHCMLGLVDRAGDRGWPRQCRLLRESAAAATVTKRRPTLAAIGRTYTHTHTAEEPDDGACLPLA